MNVDIEDDLRPVLQDFAKSVRSRVDAAEQKAEAATKRVGELQAVVNDLEQKSVLGFGSGTPTRIEGPGALVLKAGGLDQLRNGEIKSIRVAVKQFQLGHKAPVVSGDVYGPTMRDPEVIYGPVPRPTAVRDLLVVRQTSAGSVDFLRAGKTGAAAIQAAEGDIKAQLELVFTPETAGVKTIAVWLPASQQVLADNAYLVDFIEGELRDALRLEEDRQLLKGDGTGANVEGLWTRAAAYNRAVAGDTANDSIRRAITQVQLARGVATGIVVNPEGLERLELTKDADGNYVVAFPVTLDNGRTVAWRVPVVVTDALAASEFLVGDFQRAARLWDRMQATVEISNSHADFFTRNLVAVLAEERVALTIPRPGMLVKGTFS